MRLLWDRRLLIVLGVSIAASIAAWIFIITIAPSRGLEPLALTGDSKGYIILAENMLRHGVFSVSPAEPFEPESFRSPGYPAFLAGLFFLFGVSTAALFAHALFASLAPVFLFLLLRPIHEKAAFWVSIIFIFEPVRLFLSVSFLSDALFTVLFLAALAVALSAKEGNFLARAAGVGVLLGACILVRPIAIFLPLFFAAYLVVNHQFSRRGFLAGFLVGVAALAVIFPWMYRNHMLFGSWNVSSVGVANLMLYNAPEFLKWRPSEEGNAALAAFHREQESLPRHEALSLARSQVFGDTFLEVIRGREIEYAFFHIVKTVPFFVTDGLRDTVRLFGVEIGPMPNISTALARRDVGSLVEYLHSGGLAIWLFVVGVGWWGMVSMLMLFTTATALWRRDVPILFCIALIMYFAFLTGPVSNARYRVPVEGLMLFAAAYVVFRWHDARASSRFSSE